MRMIWRVLKWTLLALLAAVLMVAAINAFDEPLRPEAKAALQPTARAVPPQDNLFYALLGFDSRPADDIVRAGLEEWRRLELSASAGMVEALEANLRRQREGVPGGLRVQDDEDQRNATGSSVGEALAAIQAGRVDGDVVVAANRELLDRYRSLRRFPRFDNDTSARVEPSAVPPMAGASQARKVWLLSLAGMVAKGDVDAAVRELRDDTLFWRRMLAQSGAHLIDKMVFTAWVLQGLRSASDLVHAHGLTTRQRQMLAEAAVPLTLAERSMAGTLGYEFRLAADAILRKQDIARWLVDGTREDGPDAPPLLRRVLLRIGDYFFQRRSTVNEHHRALARLAAIEGHDCRHFEEDRRALEDAAEVDWWRLPYNPSGKLLLFVVGSGALYHPYIGRLCDLQGFQRLLALQIHLRDEGVTPQTPPADIERRIQQAGAGYADPFTGGPMHWAPARQGLAFGAADDRNRKMLPWPL